ncbi:MAG: NAD(P)H-dependent oxidoreductase [Thiovulaceae bacterium]|nr:NAD(P)H-dependent oxidoreductase [Sulfurimonadaceae bacterium]
MNQEIIDTFNFRHACKLFNDKKIPQDQLDTILEAGRLSPSSFGMEPWKFLVIQSDDVKKELKPYCWGQNQIDTCSELVIILANVKDVLPGDPYIEKMFSRRGLPREATLNYVKTYNEYLSPIAKKDGGVEAWSGKQCYIAAANMMTTAALQKIDSCPIEGFEKEQIENLLNIDTNEYRVSVMVALGYRARVATEKKRKSIEDVVEFI